MIVAGIAYLVVIVCAVCVFWLAVREVMQR